MPQFYWKVQLNLTRNSTRHMPEPVRSIAARSHVKLFHAPRDGDDLISESMIPDVLVTDAMVQRYLEIEPPGFCVPPEFQTIIDEIERAYVFGHYFSALSAACVMIERLLNMLRIGLHPFHPGTAQSVLGKGPTPNWKENIDALVEWKYLDDADTFTQQLRAHYFTRSKYLHSGPLTDLTTDTLTSIRLGYELLRRFLGFPPPLFKLGTGLECTDWSHPLAQAFYKQHIAVVEDENDARP